MENRITTLTLPSLLSVPFKENLYQFVPLFVCKPKKLRSEVSVKFASVKLGHELLNGFVVFCSHYYALSCQWKSGVANWRYFRTGNSSVALPLSGAMVEGPRL